MSFVLRVASAVSFVPKAPATRNSLLATVSLLLLASCATQPAPKLASPDWPSIPSGVLDTFCARLQMDAISTGTPLALVSTTRPLANPQSINALALMTGKRGRPDAVVTSTADLNRPLPVMSDGAICAWRPIPAAQVNAHRDELLVELSAPAINPFDPRFGGMLARVAIGGEGASWYWITLVPSGGRWVVGPIYVLVT